MRKNRVMATVAAVPAAFALSFAGAGIAAADTPNDEGGSSFDGGGVLDLGSVLDISGSSSENGDSSFNITGVLDVLAALNFSSETTG